jgi:hypothetical protein
VRQCALWAVLAVAALSGAACSGEPDPSSLGPESDRSLPAGAPLRLPTLAPGDPCPTSRLRPTSPDFAPGLGDGPAYPLGFTVAGELHIQLPPFEPEHQWSGSSWGGQKVLWVVDPAYKGPIRIRGGRLDAAGEIRFDNGLVREITLSEEDVVGWRERPSFTRLRAAGCYAYQVDGRDFRSVIVFEAVPWIQECTARDMRWIVVRFLRAFNRGERKELDLLFAAEPEFEWYSTDAPGARTQGAASNRETLLPYFARRHRRGERLTLRSFRFNGASNGYGHFEYGLVRSAEDLAPTDYYGKGAAICTVYEDFIAVWSMGREQR